MHNPLALEKQLCFRLYTANKLMTRLYAPVLKSLALTYPQYLVMLVLWDNASPILVKELAKRLDLDTGTLSPLLKRLEKQAMITRNRHTEDERSIIVRLTTQGHELKTAALHIPKKMFAVTGLSMAQLQDFSQQLDELNKKISHAI